MRFQANRTYDAKSLAVLGLMVALAAILSYVEALLPISLGVPGIKIGFANIVIVFALYTRGFNAALLISIVRIALVSAMFGNPAMAMYSVAGTLASLFVMTGLKKTGKFSIVGVSMAGGVLHNMAQLAVAASVVQTLGLLGYMPFLIIAGMIAGIFIGYIEKRIIKAIRRNDEFVF